ncbi:hypothetical protein CEUSTIGMA_g5385.t1 [Chlamydomonas eustigma]|uniref:Glycosyltransferase 2-like domain-containing protein n=1 Tax=Chlamydomonas eustigma TaxID=1157962 RepID=A0A250X4D9_9CHLO|nr:hypothetical protein CEUSTIGMA_g5385.t1 [Chlamydomonas eustigma]|eukprot:GAX77943.1 hypothetical protein CEUSTIGMA_g5385.t1 [Chlamydomonas eustigma]
MNIQKPGLSTGGVKKSDYNISSDKHVATSTLMLISFLLLGCISAGYGAYTIFNTHGHHVVKSMIWHPHVNVSHQSLPNIKSPYSSNNMTTIQPSLLHLHRQTLSYRTSSESSHKLFDPCANMLGKLPPGLAENLRDEIQVMQIHQRKLDDAERVLGAWKDGPPRGDDEATKAKAYAWNHTWASKQLEEQLMETVQTETKVLLDMQRRVKSLLFKVQRLVEEGSAGHVAGEGLKPLEPLTGDVKEKGGESGEAQFLSSCVMHRLNQKLFPDRPVVSFLLQYFKRPWILRSLVQAIQICGNQTSIPVELLVNVDNPSEAQEWSALVKETGGFVVPVFSNNVHEARAYNRLASMGRGRIMVTLQDDEVLGGDCSWLKDVVNIFDRFPQVGAVGLKTYIWAFGPNNTHDGLHFRDPMTGIPTQYVLNADYAPLAFRKSAWKHIGGIDETMSEAGECGIFGDWEFTTRMWMAGYQVMYMTRPPKEPDVGHDSGTHKPETADRCWGRQARLASGMYWSRYGQWDGPILTGLAEKVVQLNIEHLELIDPAKFATKCPFAIGCERFLQKRNSTDSVLPS